MKTLWVFGDSFSEDVNNDISVHNGEVDKYIKKYLNILRIITSEQQYLNFNLNFMEILKLWNEAILFA